MRYLSVCSGIEAATVAWHPLGWTPVAFSEIEKFPSAVLAHHYPNIPNLGDMTQHEYWPIAPGSVDLLVGGTPCQSFSVAGLRKGLADPRGNLALTYLAIADRLRPKWLVWENVPGVLSSSGGRDFGAFLGALGELGYGFAYRVLDAQYHGVAQRRRRVFLVGHASDWRRAAAVLFERESLRGDPAPSRAKGQGAAANAEASARGSVVYGGSNSECSDTVTSKWSKGSGGPAGNKCGLYVAHAIPYDLFQITAPVNRQNRKPGDPCHTLARDNAAHAAVAMVNMGGDKGGASIAMDGTSFTLSTNEPHAVVAMVNMQGSKSNAVAQADGPSYTLNAMHGHDVHAVAFPINGMCVNKELRDKQMTGVGNDGDPMFTVRSDGAQHAVAFHPTQDPISSTEVCHSISSGNGQGCATAAVAIGTDCYNGQITGDIAATMGTPGSGVNASGPTVMQAMAVRRLTPVECERLQGFLDGYTAIPWRGKPAAECPDGPRYRALGNSMAVPCMRWIGERIAQVDVIP